MKKSVILIACLTVLVLALVSCTVSHDHLDGNGDGLCDECGERTDTSSETDAESDVEETDPPKHEHTYSGDWTSDAESHWHKASCEHTDEISSKSAHMWDEGSVTVAPTEEADGAIVYKCVVCAYEKTEAIEKLAHNHTYESDWTSDAENHWHAASCEHTEELSSKGTHMWDEGTVTVTPTEGADGAIVYKCVVCAYEKTEAVDSLPHSHTYESTWSNNADGHWYAASCEHTDHAKDYSEHSFGEGVVTTAPTESAEGVKTYKCGVCGYEKTEKLDRLSHKHTYDSAWSTDADGHWHAATCEHTDHAKDYAKHIWDSGIITTEPTVDKEGIKTYTCEVCMSKKEEAVDKIPQFNLTFESEGMETYSIKVHNGGEFTFPTVKSNKDNYVIIGWKDKESGEIITSNIFTYTSDRTFVAVWGAEWTDNY